MVNRIQSVLLLFAISCLAEQEKQMYTGYKVIRAGPTKPEETDYILKFLDGHNLKLWSKRGAKNNSQVIDILCEPVECQNLNSSLAENRIDHSELISDLQELINNENPEITDEEWENRGGHRLTWKRYHPYKDFESYMDYLAATYPDMCKVYTIGKSAEGKDIKLLSISKGNVERPAIWIDGGLHAREWISSATTSYMLFQLLELQTNHPHLLNEYNWFILPIANPDGYEYSRNKDRLWRKSRHQTKKCTGVDLNRNFGYKWKRSNFCRDDYAGPHAFSEPETAAIRDFIISHKNIKAYLSMHSYSQMWLIPWGFTNEKPKDYYEMYLPAEKAVEAIKKVRGTEYLLGTPSELIYISAGASDDWAKGGAGINFAYTIELPDTGDYGFILPASQIEPVGKETWFGVKAFVEALPS